MKKYGILFILVIIFNFITVSGYSKTGHNSINKITFKDEGKLLIDMTKNEINTGYNSLKGVRVFGWKHHYFYTNVQAVYIGEILFAKSNRSKETIKVEYKLKDTKTRERSITVAGSLSGKFKSKFKDIDSEINAKIDATYKGVDSNSNVEETSFVAHVYPNTRLVYHETGEALVTNGVSKYYFLGIVMNKGEWEYIDIVTTYYELYEEDIYE